jgi:DNA (cytosine-5)-methyltransferase 1
MHEINHPQTRHYQADVWEVDPVLVTAGMPVGLLHASPDCTHHSQALGGQPRSRNPLPRLGGAPVGRQGQARCDHPGERGADAAVVPTGGKARPGHWPRHHAGQVQDATGKTVYRVAAPGERIATPATVPGARQEAMGRNWNHFVQGLRDMGYVVQWRVICNADLGAHSTRTRLYMVARRDGLPIVWPEATRKEATGQRKAWRPAAECIDWSIPAPASLAARRILAEATMRRIAHGMQKFVLGSADPFIVQHGPRRKAGPRTDQSTPTHGERRPPCLVTPASSRWATESEPARRPACWT